MRIIEANEDHVFIIQSLSEKIWPVTFSDILSAEQIAYMMDMMYSTASLERQMQEQHHRYLLVENDGEYLGYLSYELNYKDSTVAKIHKIYILPSVQGSGVGRFLMTGVQRIAERANNSSLMLNVNRNNKALHFYERLGFNIVGTEDIDIGNGFLMEDYILTKLL